MTGREHFVTIHRWHVYRVVDMPGLSRIDLHSDKTATLTFTTSPGCEPVETEFVAQEVARMGALPVRAEASHA